MLLQAKYDEFYQNRKLIQYDGFVVLVKVEYSITMKQRRLEDVHNTGHIYSMGNNRLYHSWWTQQWDNEARRALFDT